ncbi:MAG: recombinase [Bacteroides sp.]|nr:recombinase [Bacteroides sp.]
MVTTKFYLDCRRAKEGAASLLKVSITQNRNVAYITLDVRLKSNQWNADKEKIVNHLDGFLLNTIIQEKKRKIDSAIISIDQSDGLREMSAMEIKERVMALLNPVEEEIPSAPNSLFLPRFHTFVEPKKESTRNTYHHTLNRIEAYIGRDGLEALKFEDITLDWLNGFNAYMSKTSPSPNARNVHFRNLRAIFNNAIENEITTHYPFRKFKIKAVETAKRSLTVEELRRLFFFPCEPHQEKYLDMFKLMFFLMGINMIDLAKLTEITNDRLDFNRSKTGHLYSMKVEPEAMELFKKYRGTEHLLFILDRWVNDEFFRRKMNKELQKIGPMHKQPGRGGKKIYDPLFPDITAYWARHSWATIAADIDIADRVIAEALGHEYGNRITNIYINFNIKKVDAANRKVLDWVLYGKIDGKELVKPGTPEFYDLTETEAKRLGLVLSAS